MPDAHASHLEGDIIRREVLELKIPIPITVLTGFLGSGKSTLLKALLKKPEMAGTAVIVNEFGDVGLDDALIAHAQEETVLLPSGCVCCATRGDLLQALSRLYAQMQDGSIPAINRVVLETSGLADPAPIAHTLMTEDEMFRLYALDGIVTTVDAELGLTQIENHFEPAKQIAVADRIVLTKTDRADSETISAITARIRALNPSADIRHVVMGETTAELVTGLAAFEPAAAKSHAVEWLGADAVAHKRQGHEHAPHRGHHGHDHDCHGPACDHPDHDHHGDHDHTHGVRSFCLTFDEPLDGQKLSFAIELLRMTHGANLLRVKAIVAIEGEPLPFVIHGVQHIFYPPTTLDSWPSSDDRRSRFVFITKDLEEAHVRKVLEPVFTKTPAPATAFTSAD
jgi:G3E family GTPase